MCRFFVKIFEDIKFPWHSKRLLLVRLDAIGDYVLFRNFISALKKSKKYSGYKITLLGNASFKDLAEEFDKDIVDDFIWVNPHRLFLNRTNKIKLLMKLKLISFDILINPVHSRAFFIDKFLKACGAKFTIASHGDLINFSDEKEWSMGNQLYDEIYDAGDVYMFEFYRNKEFFLNLLGEEIEVKLEFFPVSLEPSRDRCKIAIFPGAGAQFRRWGPHNFAKVINVLSEYNEKLIFYIIGSFEDNEIAKEIIKSVKNKNVIKDMTGKTTLPHLISFLKSVDLLLSNETSAVHIAAALKVPTICISNGNHFLRFNPYPSSIASCVSTVYPSKNFYLDSMKLELAKRFMYKSSLDINEICVDEVIDLAKVKLFE